MSGFQYFVCLFAIEIIHFCFFFFCFYFDVVRVVFLLMMHISLTANYKSVIFPAFCFYLTWQFPPDVGTIKCHHHFCLLIYLFLGIKSQIGMSHRFTRTDCSVSDWQHHSTWNTVVFRYFRLYVLFCSIIIPANTKELHTSVLFNYVSSWSAKYWSFLNCTPENTIIIIIFIFFKSFSFQTSGM